MARIAVAVATATTVQLNPTRQQPRSTNNRERKEKGVQLYECSGKIAADSTQLQQQTPSWTALLLHARSEVRSDASAAMRAFYILYFSWNLFPFDFAPCFALYSRRVTRCPHTVLRIQTV